MLAVRLQGWPGRSPDEIGTTNACIPEVAQFLNNVLLHLFQHLRIPPRASMLRALLTNQPDGGCQRSRGVRTRAIPHFRLDRPASINDKARADNRRDQRFPGSGLLVRENDHQPPFGSQGIEKSLESAK